MIAWLFIILLLMLLLHNYPSEPPIIYIFLSLLLSILVLAYNFYATIIWFLFISKDIPLNDAIKTHKENLAHAVAQEEKRKGC